VPRRPSPRLTGVLRWAAIPLAMLASAMVVGTASYSAYSSTTVNPASNWATGTVKLSDDDVSNAMFAATGLKPGSTGSKCITVTSSGSLASSVKMYGTNASTTKELARYIDLTITQGTGGSFGSCSGFTPLPTGSSVFSGTLEAFGSTATGYASGVGTWNPSGDTSESRTYQVSYTLSSSAPDSTQGGTAAITFTWEAQNV
jgi:hypothetical protein